MQQRRGFFLLGAETSRKMVDSNQMKIHTPRLCGAVAASRLTITENAKPTNSKARQGRAVQSGVNRGKLVLSQTEFLRKHAPGQAEKIAFP